MMTGHCEEEVTNKLNRAGIADGFLFKPFNLNTLKEKIKALDDRQERGIRHVNALGG
jgi:FixJ family two-component response regulator